MELKAATDALAAQKRYGLWLAWGARLGLVLLLAGLIAYLSGLVPPHLPIEQVSASWSRPAAEMLLQAGVQPGWGWTAHLWHGDMLVVAGIALLASCSIPCLAAVIPIFRVRREYVLVTICVLQIAVLVLAASGVLAVGH